MEFMLLSPGSDIGAGVRNYRGFGLMASARYCFGFWEERGLNLEEMIYDFDAEGVIVDAGAFPTGGIPLRIMRDGKRVVCCDGAADRYIEMVGEPWRIVGDCDSISVDNRLRYADILRRFPDQETNDQTKAVRYLASKGVRRIAIVGATGLREDHTIGNVSLLIEYMKMGLDVRIFTDYGLFLPVCDGGRFECGEGKQVSIFNFGARGIAAHGLRYPLRDFDSWWEGTLNESVSDSFSLECQGYLLLFISYDRK